MVNVRANQKPANVQLIEAIVACHLGKDLEGKEITFKNVKLTKNKKICKATDAVSQHNVKKFYDSLHKLLQCEKA